MGKRKILKRLEGEFGAVPNVHYFAGDMEKIAAYYDYRRDNKLDEFMLDETTWYDLGMDDLFRRINPGLTTSGEQYLYYTLRHPAISKEDYDRRRALLAAMEDNPALRLKLQYILAKLGKCRNVVLNTAFHPEFRGFGRLILYAVLCLLLTAAMIGTLFSPMAFLPAFALLSVNVLVHNRGTNSSQRNFDTVNYALSMILALKRIRGVRDQNIDALSARAYGSLDRFRSAIRMGSVATSSGNSIADFVRSAFLLDLVAYEFLKNKLWRNHDDLFAVHELLGRLDAAIAVASFKKSLDRRCEPELDFSGGTPAFLDAAGIAHPMMGNPVRNDLAASSPVLITGSNASGKSTYLKAAALCAILAQSICVTTAKRWRASAFRIFSSMAVTDNLSAGESYFIVEIKSLKRVLDVAENGTAVANRPILAVIDEVLRGTNTVERIAASAEILHAFHDDDILCLAATHDIELCALLRGKYGLFHFEETVGGGEITFDYKLKQGPAKSRNAIELLRLMGFDEALVQKAHERADHYLDTGVWS
jgi:DNA mismatch repair ATPase MutS